MTKTSTGALSAASGAAQQHRSVDIRPLAEELLRRAPEQLIDWVVQQAQRIVEQQQQITALTQQVCELQDRLDKLERQSKRGAAPFAIEDDKRKKDRQRPGRKGGHKGHYRQRPDDNEIDQQIDMALTHCPDCGEPLCQHSEQTVEQTLIEIPPVKPQLIRLRTYQNHCLQCDKVVESDHPLKVSHARGAAGTHLGPRALAIGALLNKGLGIPMRKSCQVMKQLLGLELSAGGLSQALDRIAQRAEPDYQTLLEQLHNSPVLYTDETSWWVGGPGYNLWVLTNDQGTYYRVVCSRSKANAYELIGDYDGVLVSDCLNIYDELTPEQHKCYAHHLKAISQALQNPVAKESAYLLELRALLHGAMALKGIQAQLPTAQVQQMRQALEDNAERLLVHPRGDPSDGKTQPEQKVRQRLFKQRDHLFTFLDHDAVDATNNQAERQLRPAVVSRKLSCGNKTENGMKTWEILASLAATCQQKGLAFIDYIAGKMPLCAQ